jgi:hypothetical protein
VINNKQHFKINLDIRNINTRKNFDLHYSVSFVSLPNGCKLHTLHRLPVPIKQLSHDKTIQNGSEKFSVISILFTYWTNISNTIHITF